MSIGIPQAGWFRRALGALALAVALCGLLHAQAKVSVALADGFDFPVGKPNGDGYYIARGVRLTSPCHLGEDWNGRGGGDTDFGDPVYSMGDGVVTWAFDCAGAWGNVIIVRHAYRDPETQQVKFCDALYGHLSAILVREGQIVKRGQQIAQIGSNNGMYPAHLHFEVHHNLGLGVTGQAVKDWTNWASPSDFIRRYRRLNREWRSQPVPTGTYQEYKGHKGL